ncbi:Response regulator receiver domain protein [Posidoniimonas corsicana]|uniref:Response regulator receiver domain protein n=1 Tax=Posidoniimonas corsicana TaxID=1938618 RepID=A0A5C5VIK7_9BACT|nr:response regulator [Posidoniimonas corsicana]TWT37941.1 Response regulator receiver domain protein [Posidoniimonas corsicana]
MHAQAKAKAAGSDPSGPEECNRRVLLIDDNHAIHDDYNKILSPPSDSSELDALGSLLFDAATPDRGPSVVFQTSSAYQGQEALGLVEQSLRAGCPFAMAFVDMRMPPGWDGLETIKRLWEVDPHLQMVICSAYSDRSWDELVEELANEDQWLLLRKPFDGAEVSQLALALTMKWSLGRAAERSLADLRMALDSIAPVFGQLSDALDLANDLASLVQPGRVETDTPVAPSEDAVSIIAAARRSLEVLRQELDAVSGLRVSPDVRA